MVSECGKGHKKGEASHFCGPTLPKARVTAGRLTGRKGRSTQLTYPVAHLPHDAPNVFFGKFGVCPLIVRGLVVNISQLRDGAEEAVQICNLPCEFVLADLRGVAGTNLIC
jgi:hypothetical protein